MSIFFKYWMKVATCDEWIPYYEIDGSQPVSALSVLIAGEMVPQTPSLRQWLASRPHSRGKAVNCPYCPQALKTKTDLLWHLSRMHYLKQHAIS